MGMYEENKKFYISKEEIEQFIGETILKYLPHIIYIDDFRDNIPNKIGKKHDWYLYIKEIFFLTLIPEISAALILPPIAYTLAPKQVNLRIT